MFNLRSLLVPAAIVSASFAGSLPANAQSATCYTLESLQGSFAVIGTYGNSVAVAFSVRTIDAFGNMPTPAQFLINLPLAGSPTGARTFINGANKATYAINCDGTGVVTRVATLADLTTIPAFDDFLITEGIVQNGKLVATAISDAQRIPSPLVPGASFLTRKYARLPDPSTAGCYTRESLQGSYGVLINFGQNLALGLHRETLDGKGNLSRTGVVNQPTAGSTTGARTIGNVTNTGTYTVNCNGIGTFDRVVTRPDGTKAVATDDFIITGGIEKDGKLLATRIFNMQREPSVLLPGGVFVTRTHALRPSKTEAGTPTPPQEVRTVAVAGPKNVTETARSIQLDGTKSTSADGKPLTYLWTMVQGSPLAAILSATTATPTVQFAQGSAAYTFLLTVTDSTGATASDFVTVDYRGN